MNDKSNINVLIAGVGGQGNLLASRLLSDAAAAKGYRITIGETKGASQRSGSVSSHVRLSGPDSALGPLIPKGGAHVMLGFEPIEAVRMSRKYSGENTVAIVNRAPVVPMLVAQGLQEYPPMDRIVAELESLNDRLYMIDGTGLARRAGDSITLNVVMLGALCGLDILPFGQAEFVDAITARVPEKHRGLNLDAFGAGHEEGMRLSSAKT
jgi:indolepyruvate ferredoxin oxidoreductase beta subunit